MTQVLFKPPLTLSSHAAANRELLKHHRVLTVSLIGGPGNGKTSLLHATARRLRHEMAMAMVVANPTAQRDTEQLQGWCPVRHVVANDVSAHTLRPILDELDLGALDLLMIEHIGGTQWSPDADLGQDLIVAMFSVSAGDDKAAEFPHHVAHADLVILSKTDLLPHCRFDRDVFRYDVHKANPYVPIVELCSENPRGMEVWVQWLRRQIELRRHVHEQEGAEMPHSEWFFG